MSNSPRARALAKELRAARHEVGLSMRLVGQQLGWSEAKVSRVENAKQGITEADVSAMLAVLRVTGSERDQLLKMARDIAQPAWWELGRELPAQLTALIDAEQRAASITEVTLNLIPGLLQTRSYTKEIMKCSGVPDDEIDDLITVRQVRQGILSKNDPTNYTCFIDETILIRPVGGPRVMAEQLRQVLTAHENSNVEVRVLPLALGAHVGLNGTFVLLDFVKSPKVVYVEARSSGAFITESEDVVIFNDAVKDLSHIATSAEASREILTKYANQYESEAT